MSKTLETNSVVVEVQNRKRNNLKRKATSELSKNILVVRLTIKLLLVDVDLVLDFRGHCIWPHPDTFELFFNRLRRCNELN